MLRVDHIQGLLESSLFKNVLWLLYVVAFITLFSLILLSIGANSPQHSNFKTLLLREGGIIETIQAILLLITSIYCFTLSVKICFSRPKASTNKSRYKFILPILTLLFLIAFLEEISWGQHILGFESPTFFQQGNIQMETNLHNLVSHIIFNASIFQSVYYLLIYIPIFVLLFPHKNSSKYLSKNVYFGAQTIPILLIFVLSTFFQLYSSTGYWGLEKFDIAMAYIGFLPIVYMSFKSYGKNKKKIILKDFLHELAILCFGIVLWVNHNYYSTLVYEIREFFIMLGFSLLLLNWGPKMLKQKFE